MISNRLFRSSSVALLALIARGAAAFGQQPAFREQPPPGPPLPVKMHYDGDAKTGYSANNTDKFLKVRLWVADSQQQRKIMENGLELWVDTKGKKNKTTGIIYPQRMLPALPAEALAKTGEASAKAGPPASATGRGPRAPKPPIRDLIAMQKEIKLVGFGDDLNGIQNQHHPSGIDVSLRVVNDTLYYDAQIPLSLLPGASGDSRVSIGIIEKGKDPEEFSGAGMPGGGPPPGGGEGMGPGGPPPGDMPPGDMDIEQFANNVIWYKFSLYRQ
jgi:hypothetical protein